MVFSLKGVVDKFAFTNPNRLLIISWFTSYILCKFTRVVFCQPVLCSGTLPLGKDLGAAAGARSESSSGWLQTK